MSRKWQVPFFSLTKRKSHLLVTFSQSWVAVDKNMMCWFEIIYPTLGHEDGSMEVIFFLFVFILG